MVLKELDHPHMNKVLPDVQMESPVFKFVHIPLLLALITTEKESVYPLCNLPSQW